MVGAEPRAFRWLTLALALVLALALALALLLYSLQVGELRTRHNVRLIARHLKQWAQRRRELSEALRGWLWKRRRHAHTWLPRPAS